MHADILSRAQSDVARFGHLPLNSFERVQLLNSILIPQWVYHYLLVPDDRLFYRLDKVGKGFVLAAKGMDKVHNTSHVTAPKNVGGMGLHQVFWAYRARYIIVMQDILRRPNMIRRMGQMPVPYNVATLRNYVHALQQLGAYTTVTITQQQAQTRGGTGLYDEESDDDVLSWKAKERVVGREEYTHRYVCPNATQRTPEDGQVPPGFVPCMINGIQCYHNQKARGGTAWHSDGSKLRDPQTGAPRAGAAATCGPLQIISRVTGPQDSYRAELQGSVMVTAQAHTVDSLTLDNKAVVDYGPRPPDRESADMDLRQEPHTNLASTPIPLIWIAGHQHIRSAHTHQQKTDIRRNHEVDALAKKAAGLPLPDTPPRDVSEIQVGGGPAPTPAKKWILNRRIIPIFAGTHWTSWLPLKGTRRAYWLQWLWGNVRWEGCGHPWSKDTAPCALCGQTHRTTVHDRLTQCPTWNSPFLDLWLSTWKEWRPHASFAPERNWRYTRGGVLLRMQDLQLATNHLYSAPSCPSALKAPRNKRHLYSASSCEIWRSH